MARRATPLRETTAADPLPYAEGGFSTILADPPWRFTNRTGKVSPEHRWLDRYSSMEFADDCALSLADVAASNAHLYRWLPESYNRSCDSAI